MEIVRDEISVIRLSEMAEGMMGNLVKAVVDVRKEIMAVDGELHGDEEEALLELGSIQTDVWGINVYPEGLDYRIEFDSLINIRPRQKNYSRGVDDSATRKTIEAVCRKLIRT